MSLTPIPATVNPTPTSDGRLVQLPMFVQAIQSNAPSLTIVVPGASGGLFRGLLMLDLSRLKSRDHILFSFHFYDPMEFALDLNERYPFHYPFGLRVSDGQPSADMQYAALHFAEYFPWNEEGISSEIRMIGEWARSNQVTVICDEFGVAKGHHDWVGLRSNEPSDRSTWIQDVRSNLEDKGIGWTFWDFRDCARGAKNCGHDGFGLMDDAGRVDANALKALGQ